MKYLLDTHAVIWFVENSPRMSLKIKEAIRNPDNFVYIHAISLWEIGIKLSLGKLNLSMSFDDFASKIRQGDFILLQIGDSQIKKFIELPFIHKDPFDRLLIASALADGLTIITVDENIQKYDVPWIW